MLLQVHDELVFETDEDELSALATLAREVMEGALPLDVAAGGGRSRSAPTGRPWTDTSATTPARGVACRSRPATSPARRRKRRSPTPSPRDGRPMPELPEVETVARDLQRWVAGARITDAEVRWERTIRHPQPPEQFVAEIRGAADQPRRPPREERAHPPGGRAGPDRGAAHDRGADRGPGRHAATIRYARVVFQLADGRELRYRDVRKFGRIGLWEGGGLRAPATPAAAADGSESARRRTGLATCSRRHGPEPLATPFSAARLAERLRGRSARLKTLLLDQSFIAGVGNIYADEALWRARLHPLRARRHADAGRGAAAASGHPRRSCARASQPRAPASATTWAPTTSRATTPSGWRSTGAPASPASAAAGRSSASWSGSAARTSARTASRRAAEDGERHEGDRPDRQHRLRQEHRGGLLRDLGVAVIDADAVARQIRNNDAEARRRDRARASAPSRPRQLARIVFSDPAALRDLEAILHPRVRDETRARLAELEAAGAEAACIEAIKLAGVAAARPLRQHLGRALRRGRCGRARSRRRAAWARRRRARAWPTSRRRRRRSPPPTS